MGACYYIETKMLFNNRELVVKKAKECLKNMLSTRRAVFRRLSAIPKPMADNEIDNMLLDDVINCYIPEIKENVATNTCDEFTGSSGFDASYGWGMVVNELFDYLSPFLNIGSYLYVEPDNDSYTVRLEKKEKKNECYY